jgi:hypothetical protein
LGPDEAGDRRFAASPAESLAKLWPQSEAVELYFCEYVMQAGEPVTVVYLPASGCAPMLARLEDGAAAEVKLLAGRGLLACRC